MGISKQHLLLTSKKYSNSLFFGNFRSAFLGKGLEFHDFRPYDAGDDAKYIDWIASKREHQTLIRRHNEEKQGNIYFVFDFAENIFFEKEKKLATLQQLLEILTLAVWKNGLELQSYFTFSGKFLQAKKNAYIRLSQIVSELEKINFSQTERKYDVFFTPKIKRGLLFLFSDSFNISELILRKLSLKYDVIFVYISSHFENTLESNNEIRYIKNASFTGYIDTTNIEKREKYIGLQSQEKSNFIKKMQTFGIDFLDIDEATNLMKSLLLLMKMREGKK